MSSACDRVRGRDERIRAVIDVEEGALGALEHDPASAGHRAMKVERRVGDEWLKTRPDPPQVREDALPLHGRVADRAVARGDIFPDGARQSAVSRAIRQIAHPDASRRRPDLAVAAARFGQHLELAMIRQDHVRLVADEQPAGHVDAEPG